MGIVVHQGQRSRDYKVRLPSGRCLWRNRRFIRVSTPEDHKQTTNEERNREPPESPEPNLRRSKRVRNVGGEENLAKDVPRAIRPILIVEGLPRLHGHCMHSELIEVGQTCPLH
eukprot:snap_masked-scaffold59_size442576-processed-gene-3.22 protein:Tk11681 transcript:snap_masked-scaffold59_size442576-processed-gene-3.22-mRNA-1 annotation:"hypothetical protein DAPPUDRAFT_113293"